MVLLPFLASVKFLFPVTCSQDFHRFWRCGEFRLSMSGVTSSPFTKVSMDSNHVPWYQRMKLKPLLLCMLLSGALVCSVALLQLSLSGRCVVALRSEMIKSYKKVLLRELHWFGSSVSRDVLQTHLHMNVNGFFLYRPSAGTTLFRLQEIFYSGRLIPGKNS